jgi:hypothetical protein
MSIAELRKLLPTEKLKTVEAPRETEAEFAPGRIEILDWEDAKKELRKRSE